eukprot:CAMPEP_0117452550 /NCGR_PEP_ID=MMETSP0759-20121206/9686_1 /TAXON_ID=63605 /ORGANISM="Percolomonas cosmopolitus, Strain WS" /LENGTH=306 /DNA_ID=CAMNT_0005245395 /DNA_START=10 /DNA_END=930 /DNA_ORIENTATION=-
MFRNCRIPARSLLKPSLYCQQQRFFRTIGVVGAGQMGQGIAQVASQFSGAEKVYLQDVSEKQLDTAKAFTHKLLHKNVAKGKISEQDAEQILGRIQFVNNLEALQDADFVIEAAPEILDLKKEIFQKLDKITGPDTILATNTSSISVTQVAAVTKRPEKVISMHFMNPVPHMKLVEVIRGLQTSDATYQQTVELAQKMQKVTTLSKDMPGFIANRILMPYINEAIFVLQEGIASVDDIDSSMKMGTNVPMGPLTLADFIGLDTCLSILRVLHTELGDSKYRPCPLLVKYVEAGWLGRKSGRGFYTY